MNLLFDITDLDEDSKRKIFQYFILLEYRYVFEKSTAADTFYDAKAYEINILTKEIREYNRTFSCFSKPNKDDYYIKVKQ